MAPKLIPTATRRLFFAAFPDPLARAAIDAEARRRASAADRRPVPTANLHLTLLFIGDIGADRVADLQRAAEGLSLPRFALSLDRPGRFIGSDAVWLGPVESPPEPALIHGALRARCVAAGFELRPGSFHPHVTIFRERRRAPALPPDDGEPLAVPIPMAVDAFALVVSEPAAGGRRYRPLSSWSLA